MYRLLDLEEPSESIAEAEELHILFATLDKPEYLHKKLVIVDEGGEIRAGKACAWDRSKQKQFIMTEARR